MFKGQARTSVIQQTNGSDGGSTNNGDMAGSAAAAGLNGNGWQDANMAAAVVSAGARGSHHGANSGGGGGRSSIIAGGWADHGSYYNSGNRSCQTPVGGSGQQQQAPTCGWSDSSSGRGTLDQQKINGSDGRQGHGAWLATSSICSSCNDNTGRTTGDLRFAGMSLSEITQVKGVLKLLSLKLCI